MAAVVGVDAGSAEATKDLGQHALVQERLPVAKWEFVGIAHGYTVRDIKIAGAVPGSRISPVGRGAGVGLQLLGSIIQGTRVRIGRAKIEPVAETAQQACFQTVVISVPVLIQIFDVAEVCIRDRARYPVSDDWLVKIAQPVQMI